MIQIYGHSDDCIELEGLVSDEIYGNRIRVTAADGHGGVYIEMHYGGTWSAKIEMFDEEVPIPWPISVRHGKPNETDPDPGYTVTVEIDCPDDVGVCRWDIANERWVPIRILNSDDADMSTVLRQHADSLKGTHDVIAADLQKAAEVLEAS